MNIENALAFCPVLADIVQTQKLVGETGEVFEGLGSMSTVNNLLILRNLQLQLKPRTTLEIGLAFGGSCLVMSGTHRDLGALPSRQHVAIDPFQSVGWDNTGLMAVERAGLGGYLDFRPTLSCCELPRMVQEGLKFDLVYIDGSHLFEDVFVDHYFVSRLLSDSGIVAFDDSSNDHVRKVLKFIRSNAGSCLEPFDLSTFRLDKGKPIKYRLARAFGRMQMTAFRKKGKPEREWNSIFRNF